MTSKNYFFFHNALLASLTKFWKVLSRRTKTKTGIASISRFTVMSSNCKIGRWVYPEVRLVFTATRFSL